MKMPEKKAKGVVPPLRFPEFRNTGPWEVKQLGEVFDERNERNAAELELLSVTLSDGVVRASDLERRINASSDLSNYKRVYHNDIVYNSMRMWQGASGVSYWDGIVSPAYTVVTPKEGQNPVFWGYYFKTYHAIEKFLCFSQGVTSDTWNLKYPAFSEIKLASPLEPCEQQKIAYCLSSLDDLIRAEGEQLEALKEHKKGLMQRLFPREGQITPELRFPEFRDNGPWEVKQLGEIGNIIRGKGISKSDIEPNGMLPCIHYGELYTYYGEVIFKVVSSTNADSTNLVLSKRNDVIIPSSGETKEDIATASCITMDGVAIGSDINIFQSSMNGAFLAYYVRGNLKAEISKIAQGDSVVHLYPNQLEKVRLAIPPTAQEQQKIANCLSSLDDLIRAQEARIDALKQHKKGLMQQLFPNPEQQESTA